MTKSFLKYILIHFFSGLQLISLGQEVGSALDVEYDTYCMMDSIGPNNEIEFVRLYYYNKNEYKNLTADLSASYTVQGTPLPCWQLTGSKECWLMGHTTNNNNYSFGLDAGQLGNYDTDHWLVALRLREHYDLLLLSKRRDFIIPLNYPYGNTEKEAVRLENDLFEYMECKGMCQGVINSVVGPNSLSLDVQLMWFQMTSAIYSTDPASPYPEYIFDVPVTTLLGTSSCSMVHDIYRKEKNGAILYYIDPDGVVNSPPLPFSKEKVSCDYETERVFHCDRPVKHSECWATTLEDQICSYSFIIPDSLELDSLWINGDQILTTTYCPVATDIPICPSHNALIDSLIQEYEVNNWWGRVAVDNTVNGKPGFLIHVNNTNMPIDSIKDGNGTIHYPIIEDCRTFAYYDVSRNELGGIINCQDQYGHDRYCPPESARRVSCETAEGKAGCRVQGKWGTEIVTTDKTFDIGKFWSFSYIVKDTSATISTLNFEGDTVSFECPIGFSEKYTSSQDCRLIQSSYLRINASGGGKVKISYGW